MIQWTFMFSQNFPCILRQPFFLKLKPSTFIRSKSPTMPHTRPLKCSVLQHSVITTKHSRSLVRSVVWVVQGCEWLEILGFKFSNWHWFWAAILCNLQIILLYMKYSYRSHGPVSHWAGNTSFLKNSRNHFSFLTDWIINEKFEQGCLSNI